MGAFVENIDMTTVFNRDGWICGICRCDIDPKLRHPNKRAATLDHIIPLSKGGQHFYGNIQAAHYSCNSKKRDRLTTFEIKRFKYVSSKFS